MYCLLQILMNEEDLQEMNMIILGCYCTFPHKQQLKVNFQILMEIMHSYILYYFFVILPALLHFCSFIYTAFLCIKGQPLFLKRAFPKGKGAWSKKLLGAILLDSFLPPRPRIHGSPEILLARTTPGSSLNICGQSEN